MTKYDKIRRILATYTSDYEMSLYEDFKGFNIRANETNVRFKYNQRFLKKSGISIEDMLELYNEFKNALSKKYSFNISSSKPIRRFNFVRFK